jgi:serine/threonine protein phosphatase PrpC
VVIATRCAGCGATALADDDFCERCGRDLAEPARDHVEVDVVTAAGVSDRGCVHERNEDALYLEVTPGRVAVVVADGVSTSAGPHIAASAAAEAAGAALLAGADPVAAAAAADVAVQAVAWSGEGEAPSCTIVAAVLAGGGLAVAWLGDSRAYRIVDGRADLLTADHTLATSPGEVSHAITRWVGAGAPAGPAPVARRQGVEGGRLLLCTDGLWNLVADEELVVLATGGTPAAAARRLVAAAIERGGRDNVTVVVVDVDAAADGSEGAP